MNHMISYLLKKTLLTALLIFSAECFSQYANDIIGKWQNVDDASFQIEIYLAKDGNYYGKILNDSKSQGNKGKIVLHKLSYHVDKKIYTGIMNPPDANIKLNAEIVFVSSKKLKINVRKFLMSKTMYLTKLS